MKLAFLLITVFVTSCQTPASDVEDSLCGQVSGQINPLPPNQIVYGDLKIRGSATQKGGLAIRSITVLGISATPLIYDFSSWEVLLPFDTLRNNTTDGVVKLTAIAIDACGEKSQVEFPSINVTIDPAAIASLKKSPLLIPSYPGNAKYLPADGSASASITVVTNLEAVGLKLNVTKSIGDFIPNISELLLVPGTDDLNQKAAVGTFLFRSMVPGLAIIVAQGQGAPAGSLTVPIIGPPRLEPAGAMLTAGIQINVVVNTDGGTVRFCQASPSSVLTAFSGGHNLAMDPAAVDTNGDGRPDLIISSAAGAAMASITVTCVDYYNQLARATFSVP